MKKLFSDIIKEAAREACEEIGVTKYKAQGPLLEEVAAFLGVSVDDLVKTFLREASEEIAEQILNNNPLIKEGK